MSFEKNFCSRLPSLAKIGVLVGLILLTVPQGIPYYYGNLSVYTDSYFIYKDGAENNSSGSMWLVCLFETMLCVGITVGGILIKRIGPRASIILGAVIFDVAIIATYFAVEISIWGMNITLGVLVGTCTGIHNAVTVFYATAWFPNNVGTATSIAISALGSGSLILNLVITFFINPQNKAADLRTATGLYFSDENLLRRVPFIFLVIGGITIACHIAATILLKTPPSSSANFKTVHYEPTVTFNSSPDKESDNLVGSGTVRVEYNEDLQDTLSEHRAIVEIAEQQTGLTTKQLLKSGTFYSMAVILMVLYFGLNVENTYYKQFGMIIINDDFFLTSVGVSSNIVICFSCMVWGYVADTWGPKMAIIIHTSIHTILASFWYFTPIVSKWLYLFWTLSIQAVQSSIFVVYPVMCLYYFGSKHNVTNYGVVMSSATFINFVAPPVVNVVLNILGYIWVFLIVALLSALGFGLSVALPEFGLR